MHIQSLSFSYLSTRVLQRFMFMLFWMLSPIAAYADAKVGPHKNGPAGQLSAAHKALICAIQENNLQKVTALLRDKKNINSQDFLGYSPLHYAAKYAKETIVARLLEAKPLLDQVSVQSGYTPLLLAIRRGHKKIVALLLTAGANPNMVNHAGYNGLQLAIQQNRKDLVKLLLQTGASCNILPSPLLMAIKQRSLPIVQCLLRQEKIIETQDSQGFTELHWAAKQNIVTIFRLLLNADCFNVNAKAANGATPLHLIAANKKIRLLKAVLQCPLLEVNVQDSTGSTPLHYAVATNQLKAVNALLGHPCIKVNLQNNRGQTTLHYAVLYERTAILKKLLPYTGKGIFIRNQEGITPLELAMRQNNATMHKLILAHTSLLSVD